MIEKDITSKTLIKAREYTKYVIFTWCIFMFSPIVGIPITIGNYILVGLPSFAQLFFFKELAFRIRLISTIVSVSTLIFLFSIIGIT